jgi:hypothetical protein
LFRRFEATLEIDGAENLLLRAQYLEEARSLVAKFGINAIEGR